MVVKDLYIYVYGSVKTISKLISKTHCPKNKNISNKFLAKS